MISPERLDVLRRQWVWLLEAYSVTPADAYPTIDRLVAAYSEPHRHYHTLEHIAEMLRVVGRLAGYCVDPRAVQLAVWFHDVVYDPRATDNEEQSANRVTDWLGARGLSTVVLASVADLVRATDHHTEANTAPDTDVQVLLDADLAILAASEARYRRYASDIRKEYAFVPEAQYRTARVSVLEKFLARPKLFHHPLMIAEGERVARHNLQAEIAELHKPLTANDSELMNTTYK
jgi:predicted metal-dependent HD superfamily phosphohydrolase